MRGIPHKVRALACLVVALVTGCLQHLAPLGVDPTPLGLQTGTVQLELKGFGSTEREAQVVPSFSVARFSIDGATLQASRSAAVSFSLGAAAVTLRNVPVGSNMVLSVDGLDAGGQVLASAHYATSLNITSGATTSALIGVTTTPTAEVVRALLQLDRLAGRDASHSFAARLDTAALQAHLDSERVRLGLVHPILFDPGAIARAVAITADPNAAASVPPPGGDYAPYTLSTGRALIWLAGLPEGTEANVWIDDPLSSKQNNLPPGGAYVSPVAPGTWTVHADVPNGPSTTASVTVPAGLATASSPVTLDFRRWQLLSGLPKALAGTANATMSLGGTTKLVLAGGMDGLVAGDGTIPYATSSCYAFDGVRLSPLASLPIPLAYASTAVVGNTMYVFGGMKADRTPSSDLYAFDGQSWSGPIATVSFNTTVAPLVGAACAAFGSNVYLFGGSVGQYAQVFDTVSRQFGAAPSMNVQRMDPASVVYQGKLYVFGGSNDYGFVSAAEAFDPQASKWTNLAQMPVARFGARAIAYDGKIDVIGGMSPDGRPSARVDVYDPMTNTWSLFSALNVARGGASLARLGNRLYVLGGSDGLFYQILNGTSLQKSVPVNALEVLSP